MAEENPRQQVPPYVALVRIFAVVGMSGAAALGIFLLLVPAWVPGLISLACTIPFFVLMRLVEGTAEPDETPSE